MNRIGTLVSGFSPCLRQGRGVNCRLNCILNLNVGSRNRTGKLYGVPRSGASSVMPVVSSFNSRMYSSDWRSEHHHTPVIKPSHNGNENHYAHTVLETLDGYRKRMVTSSDGLGENEEVLSILDKIHSEQFDGRDPESVLGILKDLSLLSDHAKKQLYHSETFWEFCGIVTDCLPQCSSEYLVNFMELIAQLGQWDSIPEEFTAERGRLLAQIRNQCATNAAHSSKDQLLFMLNIMCIFKTKIIPDEMYSKLESEVVNMDKEEVIQLLYYLSLVRNADPGLLQELEDKLERIRGDLTDDELAVACLGFFKTQHMIRSQQVINEILDRLRSNSATMNEMCVVFLMKCVNYSLSRDVGFQDGLRTSFRSIMKNIYPRLGEFENSTCVNLFRMCHSLRMMDHNFIDAMCQRVINHGLSHWRLKDVSFFLFRCASFQAMLAEKDWFYKLFVKELESSSRKSDLMKFPRCLLQALTGLAYVEIFPYDLINECLSPSYRKLLMEKSNIDPLRELIVLDQSVEIECPDYSGCRLPSDMTSDVKNNPKFKNNTQLPHEKRYLSKRDQMLLDIQAKIDMLFGGDPIAELAFVLPHFQTADIMMEVDENQEICQLSEWIDREQPRKGHKRIVLICASPNEYHIYETDYGHSRKISGIHVMKRRQLQKLGFTIVELPYFEWNKSNRDFNLKMLLRPFIKME